MKTKTLPLAFIFLFLFGCSNNEEIPIEQIANEAISGKWKINTWDIDGLDVKGKVVDYYLDFIFQGKNKGVSKWETYLGRLLTSQHVPYEIINSGTEIDLGGQVLEIKFFVDSILVFQGDYEGEFWEIKAERY